MKAVSNIVDRQTVPNVRSAHAILMTRNKPLLRRYLFTANKTMVSKFRTTINMDVKINAVHNAMPSSLEGTILDEPVSFSELVVADSILIIF